MLQLLLVGNNVLKLWWDGCVLVGLALARPSKALPASKPLSLAVESAGRLSSAEGELCGAEVAAALAVLLAARPVLLPDGVAGGRAEGVAQVAAGGEESSQRASEVVVTQPENCHKEHHEGPD